MTINVTQWSPDTCGCITRYSWDTTTSEDDRVHTYHSHPRVCPAHHGLTGPTLHDVLVIENSRKNVAVDHILTRRPDLRAKPGDIATKNITEGIEWELLRPHLAEVDAALPHDPDDPTRAFARMFALHTAHARTLPPVLRFDHEFKWSYEGKGDSRRLNADVVDLVTGESVLEPAHVEELATFRPPFLMLHGKKAARG